MKKNSATVVAIVVSLGVGLVGGSALTARQAPETNYMAIQEWRIGPGMSINEGIGRMSEFVRILRATGKHESVRLFRHDWGPEVAVYLVSETSDWNAIGTVFADIVAAQPDFPDQPFGFAGHSDNILAEIPVE